MICDDCKYLRKYKHNAYIILNFVCNECKKTKEEDNKVKK